MGRDGDVWMSKYETYSEKKWVERHGIWEDPIHLRRENRRIEDQQRRENRGSESTMNHLYDVEMTWWSHGKGAWKMSLKLFLLSLTAAVHGLLPFTFISSTSNGVKKLHEEL